MLPTADTNEIERDWNVEMMYVKKKVMTDEQIETLRKQIAAYGTICEQLVQMHKTHSSNQHLTGVRGMYFDPMITKIGSRQRWAPTTVQLQTLEQIFDAETGTPSKEKIKEITANLTKHGQISETNIYNWFQNRRARSKRKQQSLTPTSVNPESEVETNVDSKDKNTKPDEFVASQPAENLCRKNSEAFSVSQYLNPEPDDRLPNSSSSDYLIEPLEALEDKNNGGSSDYLVEHFEAPEKKNNKG